MPMSLRRKVVALAAALVPLLAIAAEQRFDIRPGAWKYTMGINLGNGTSTITDSSCLTAEDIRAMRVLQMGPAATQTCTAEVTHQSSRLLEGVLQCRDKRRTTRIQVRLQASSPTQFSGTMRAAGTDGTADIEVAAEWVAADCRAVDEDDEEGWDVD